MTEKPCFDDSHEWITKVELEAAIRECEEETHHLQMIRQHTPACPACGEVEQIQLTRWIESPTQWRCRSCKHSFVFETSD